MFESEKTISRAYVSISLTILLSLSLCLCYLFVSQVRYEVAIATIFKMETYKRTGTKISQAAGSNVILVLTCKDFRSIYISVRPTKKAKAAGLHFSPPPPKSPQSSSKKNVGEKGVGLEALRKIQKMLKPLMFPKDKTELFAFKSKVHLLLLFCINYKKLNLCCVLGKIRYTGRISGLADI